MTNMTNENLDTFNPETHVAFEGLTEDLRQSEFNQCSGLVDQDKVNYLVDEYSYHLREDEQSPTTIMLDMQSDLQDVYTAKHGRSIAPGDIKTKGELITFLKDQKEAFDDEFRELIEAVHGMSRPASERSAGWKKWKGDYDRIRAEGVDECLTADDIVERDMEFVDMYHFFMNMQLALKMSEEKLFVYYNLKNKENHDRQVKDY